MRTDSHIKIDIKNTQMTLFQAKHMIRITLEKKTFARNMGESPELLNIQILNLAGYLQKSIISSLND